MTEDFDLLASRATEPFFYRAPWPENNALGIAPREYQLAGPEYCLARDNAMIGDAPGVGKTCQGILISNAIGARKTLVIPPASLRLNWEREIDMWSTIPNVTTYPIMKSSDGVSHEHNYVIPSYDLLRNPDILQALLSTTWDHLILDEAHYLKDPKGNKRTKAIGELLDRCGRITLLTGTPLPNQPVECYNAIRMCNWDAINRASLEDFMATYYDYGEGFIFGPVQKMICGACGAARNAIISRCKSCGSDVPGGTYFVRERHWSDHVRNVPVNLDDLQYRLRKYIMVRRLKKDVLAELPPKQWHLFPVELTADIRKAMKHPGWAEAEALYELDPDAFEGSIPVDGSVSTARRLLGEAKAPVVAKYIEDMLESGVEKIIVAAWHHSVLGYLRERLHKHGLVYMDGTTSPRKVQSAVDEFQGNPNIHLILGQEMVIGKGHTLTAAADVVNAEPDWVPGNNDQLLDRAHRYGQTENVIGHLPIVPGTLDERILSRNVEKDTNIYGALDKQ